MSETIYKYPIIPNKPVMLPEGAEILCIQTQEGKPTIWAKVDPKNPPIWRKIYIYGTGHVMQDVPQKYIGTYQLANGYLVFHAFEEIAHDAK